MVGAAAVVRRTPSGRWDLFADVGLVTVHHSGTIAADETTIEALPQLQANGTTGHLDGVWGSSKDNGFAVGQEVILHSRSARSPA